MTGKASCDRKIARAIMVGALENEASGRFDEIKSVGKVIVVGMWFHFAMVVKSGDVVAGVGLEGGADRGWFEITGQGIGMVAIMETNGIDRDGVEVVDSRGIERGGRIGRDADLDNTKYREAVGELIRGFEGEVSGGGVGATGGIGFGGGREAGMGLTGGNT